MTAFHIGLDLDNTLIDYDAVFPEVGQELGLLSPDVALQSKEQVKSFLQAKPDGETLWMRLQGQVYGRYLGRARLYDGVEAFVEQVRKHGCQLSIVSHKTKRGHFDPHNVDLWDAALDWLETKRFFAADGFGMRREDVHFSETREGKLAVIRSVGCELFIDDLPEVLHHGLFPENARKLWFAAHQPGEAGGGLPPHRTWAELAEATLRLLKEGVCNPRDGR